MECVALGWLYVASALFLATERPRGEPRWSFFRSRHQLRAGRGAAALLVLAATGVWNVHEPGPAAFIAIPVALMACGTLITLLVPLQPRLVWVLAIAALPLTLLLIALEGVRG